MCVYKRNVRNTWPGLLRVCYLGIQMAKEKRWTRGPAEFLATSAGTHDEARPGREPVVLTHYASLALPWLRVTPCSLTLAGSARVVFWGGLHREYGFLQCEGRGKKPTLVRRSTRNRIPPSRDHTEGCGGDEQAGSAGLRTGGGGRAGGSKHSLACLDSSCASSAAASPLPLLGSGSASSDECVPLRPGSVGEGEEEETAAGSSRQHTRLGQPSHPQMKLSSVLRQLLAICRRRSKRVGLALTCVRFFERS